MTDDPRSPFTADEWTALEFAVLDVFWLAAAVDGRIDTREAEAMAGALSTPDPAGDPLSRALFESVGSHHEALISAYRPGNRTHDDYEASLRRVGALIDERIDGNGALGFKNALIDLGVAVANASGKRVAGRGRMSDLELVAIARMSDWLGLPT